MSDESYLDQLSGKRITRRRFMTMGAVGAAGLAAAGLVGCSSNESTTSGTATAISYPDQGISDTEIKLGCVLPISGPILGSNALPNSYKAYWEYVNAEKNGVDGRKVTFILYDGAYNPVQTLDQVRRLVEQDKVFALVELLGTPTNQAIQPYVEQNKVPNMFIGSGASVFLDPKAHPYTTMGNMPYVVEGGIIGDYIAKNMSGARIGVFRQNDPLGESFLDGLKKGLGADKAGQIVSVQTYETTDVNMSAQALAIRNANCDAVCCFSILRPTVPFVKECFNLGFKPTFFAGLTSGSLDVIKAVGQDQFVDKWITVFPRKDPRDPTYANDPAVQQAKQIISKYEPSTDTTDPNFTSGLDSMAVVEQCLKNMKTPTRQGFIDSVRSVKGFLSTIGLPGCTWDGSTSTNATQSKERLAKWGGDRWVQFGDVVDGAKYLA
ncbi:MAG TPA: ABC transporter substrate-binding protein [Dehalococcoidia bacterium]|nr:ABC transporter substrate-binding protein [Dehalococcoidia bacterium]